MCKTYLVILPSKLLKQYTDVHICMLFSSKATGGQCDTDNCTSIFQDIKAFGGNVFGGGVEVSGQMQRLSVR